MTNAYGDSTKMARAVYNGYSSSEVFTKTSMVNDVKRRYPELLKSKTATDEWLKKTVGSYIYRLEKSEKVRREEGGGPDGTEIRFIKIFDDLGKMTHQEVISTKEESLEDAVSATGATTILEQDFDAGQLGFAVLKVISILQVRISNRETKIINRDAKIADLKEEIDLYADENASLQQNLRDAQNQILNIQKKITPGNGATLNLGQILKDSE
jgi:hypothetical protein